MAPVILQQPGVLLFLPLLWLLFLLFAWPRRFKPFGPFLLRLALIVLVTLALTQPVWLPSPPPAPATERPERQVWLVDQSDSLGAAGKQALRAEAERLTRALTDTVTLYFAGRAVVVSPLKDSLQPQSLPVSEAILQPSATNLAAALTTGAAMLKGQSGRLVLFSDGQPTGGDITQVIDTLARQGIPVDTLLLEESSLQSRHSGKNEVSLVKLSLPPVLRPGETFAVEVTIHSRLPATTTLSLAHGQTVLAEDVITLETGLNRFTFETQAQNVGLQIFRADLAADNDGEAANNHLTAITHIYPAPQILLVGDSSGQADHLTRLLRQAGFAVDRLSPADLPTRLSELESYAGMGLVNVSARTLKLEQRVAIQEFVRSQGRGLLVTGGENNFSLDDYQDDLLPVSPEPHRPTIREGEFQATVAAPDRLAGLQHPMLRGLCLDSGCAAGGEPIPPLHGYLVQSLKPRAEAVLQIGPGDPLLSVWGYGLGRVAVWASAVEGDWVGSWQNWPKAARFWGQVIGYILPAPDLGLLQLKTDLDTDGVVTITANSMTAAGQPIDLARTEATLTTPGGRDLKLTLRQVAPGRYQQILRLADPGAYQLSVTQARLNAPPEKVVTGFVLPYPAEYALPVEGAGEPLLRQIAQVTGGRTFTLGVESCVLQAISCQETNPVEKTAGSFIEDFKSQIVDIDHKSQIELWPWLLLAALVLWPIEIAWRRWSRLRIQ